ncbi:hypothetical protein AB205_0088530 [Aquarana catesbeiana]|uniref:Uncharacterized protein n=1 Tax=Aquarana catesbeiana TaxID=8400 RepID=A0A2G9RSU2_AQUCT|nr:hypothetical protein AB205_0088530 [Aquarana catesbeiana]
MSSKVFTSVQSPECAGLYPGSVNTLAGSCTITQDMEFTSKSEFFLSALKLLPLCSYDTLPSLLVSKLRHSGSRRVYIVQSLQLCFTCIEFS